MIIVTSNTAALSQRTKSALSLSTGKGVRKRALLCTVNCDQPIGLETCAKRYTAENEVCMETVHWQGLGCQEMFSKL